MNDRLAGLKRILKVQEQVKRIADWRVVEAERHKQTVEEARRVLGAYLDGEALDGALAVAAVDQARRLGERDTAAARAVGVEVDAARQAQGRQKLVARLVEGLAREDRAARDRKELDRLVEAFTNRAARPESDAEPDHPTK